MSLPPGLFIEPRTCLDCGLFRFTWARADGVDATCFRLRVAGQMSSDALVSSFPVSGGILGAGGIGSSRGITGTGRFREGLLAGPGEAGTLGTGGCIGLVAAETGLTVVDFVERDTGALAGTGASSAGGSSALPEGV